MPNNVYNIPVYGQPIEPDEQGIYYAINRKTGDINNVFQLVYESATNAETNEDQNWYLYQLKNTGKNGEMGWVILADNGDYPLKEVSTEEIKHHFDKPEYAEPKGAWQLIRNSRYGFGKFTPIHADENIRFAMILFSGAEMLVPLLILKADDNPDLQSTVEPEQ
ncbi:MAG: hypothetical protein PSV17_02760 [Methylotenera sp.]|uniref:hypothetical protein n=1 Tax=Methylotenera sp. TaxID=2051956 RepID=UPI002489858D|nr:hypothetical protein [Methylotenera sp.]MDI1308341.1 hypothetical protein [Methylotenera sp.]